MLCQLQETMRIELGSDGKIIGSRRVSPNGQVSGLTEFAGREVLVILPGATHTDSATGWAAPDSITQAVEEQMRQAYERYEILQKIYATPWEATRSFVRNAFGISAPDIAAEVDRWVKSHLENPSAPLVALPSSPRGAAGSVGARRRSRASRKRTDASDGFI
jgi:hypothetical protein